MNTLTENGIRPPGLRLLRRAQDRGTLRSRHPQRLSRPRFGDTSPVCASPTSQSRSCEMLNCREKATSPASLVGRCVEAAARRFPILARRSLNAYDEDVKPLLLGYIRRDLMVTDGQANELVRQMAMFAKAEGFSMGFTYIEKPGTWPAAFEAMIESVNRDEVTAVVLPSLLHFAVLGAPLNITDMFERATGARVLVLGPQDLAEPVVVLSPSRAE